MEHSRHNDKDSTCINLLNRKNTAPGGLLTVLERRKQSLRGVNHLPKSHSTVLRFYFWSDPTSLGLPTTPVLGYKL